MDYSSNTSIAHPYGSQSGINIASTNPEPKPVAAQEMSGSDAELSDRSAQASEKAFEIANQRQEINEQERERVVEHLNEFMSSINKNLSFRTDEESGQNIVSIFDVDTGELIRQIPDEELLEVLRRLRHQSSSYSSGLLIDKV